MGEVKRLTFGLEIGILILFLNTQGLTAEKKADGFERAKIGTGQMRNMNVLPMELGIQKGIYKKEGADLEILLIRGFIAMAALKNGEIDFVHSGGELVRFPATGMPTKVIMVLRSRAAQFLVARPGINSVKDLKGKTIAISSIGSTQDFGARAVLRYHGLDPDKDAVLRPVGAGHMTYVALKNGMVDAGIMNVLHVLNLQREKRGFKELMYLGDVMKGISNVIVASESRIKERPALIKKVIRGTLKSINYIRGNRTEVIDIMIKDWGLEKELAHLLYDREKDGFSPDGKATDSDFQEELKLARERGFIPNKEVPTSLVRDFNLLEEVLKETGLNR